MKKIIISLSILSIFSIVSCKVHQVNSADYNYKSSIKDSVLIPVSKEFGKNFVFAKLDTVVIKANYKSFIAQIDSILTNVNGGRYLNAYQELKDSILYRISQSDSVNLLELNNKLQGRSLYAIHGLIKSSQLAVFSEINMKYQDSIWEKDYYAESLYKDSIRMRFYEGKIYGLKSGIDFLKIEIVSGH